MAAAYDNDDDDNGVCSPFEIYGTNSVLFEVIGRGDVLLGGAEIYGFVFSYLFFYLCLCSLLPLNLSFTL
ncbi:MAG: hypothetical protein WKF36_03750 [Candidatus Nitrosocosmicus sp.]